MRDAASVVAEDLEDAASREVPEVHYGPYRRAAAEGLAAHEVDRTIGGRRRDFPVRHERSRRADCVLRSVEEVHGQRLVLPNGGGLDGEAGVRLVEVDAVCDPENEVGLWIHPT